MTNRPPGARHPQRLLESVVQSRHVPYPERDDRAGKAPGADRQLHGICSHRRHSRPVHLSRAGLEHRLGEIGSYNETLESGQPRNLRRDIQSPRAEIQVGSGRVSLDVQLRDRPAPPSPVDVQTQDVIEEIVSRGDLREHPLDVRALLGATGSGGTGGRAVYVGGQHPSKVARQQHAGQAILPAPPQ